MLTFRITLILFLATAGLLRAQQEPVWHFWLDANPSYAITAKLRLFGDVGIQRFTIAQPAIRYNIRPGFMYTFSKNIKATAGVGYFLLDQQPEVALHELRPYVGLQAQWPYYANFSPTHYLRIEARNLWPTGAFTNFYATRVRYEFKNQFSWQFVSPACTAWYSPLAAEVFFGFSDHNTVPMGFERLRISAGAGVHLNTYSRVELLYIYQGNRALVNDFLLHTTDHMFRLRYYVAF